MSQLPQLNAEQLAALNQFAKKAASTEVAGKIKGTKRLNNSIETCNVLNNDDSGSTIKQIHKIDFENISPGIYMKSLDDEELLFVFKFRNEITINSITFYALKSPDDDTSEPQLIYIGFPKNDNFNFDDANDMKPNATLKCKKNALKNGQKLILKGKKGIPKKVKYCVIYIKSNLGDTDYTFINGIEFHGIDHGLLYCIYNMFLLMDI